MLGFDALGRNALGQVPGSSVVAVFLTGKVTASARSRVQFSGTGILTGKIAAQAKVRASTVPVAVMSARSKSMLSAKTPGGFGLGGKIATRAEARAPGGYAIYAKMTLMSSGLSAIHLEGNVTTIRLPLLFNSGSKFTVGYWKGQS